jgi:hypothetical protein
MSFICPSCQSRLAPGQSACPACLFSLEELDRRLGIPPQLFGPVADPLKTLSSSAVRRITSQVDRIERKFPQVRVAVALQEVPYNVTLPVFTFWLFNRGGFSSSVDRGAENFLVLLLINVSPSAPLKASAMIGYGLEPFLSSEDLAACLTLPQTSGAEALAQSFLKTLETTLINAVRKANPAET